MNTRHLRLMGIPEDCIPIAIQTIQTAVQSGLKHDLKKTMAGIVASPKEHISDAVFGKFAAALVEEYEFKREDPITYKTWGNDIDDATHEQMRVSCTLPNARAAALMPDAHVGYGLPIGGVLALDNAVCPYAVGVDIACRMKLSIIDIPSEDIKKRHNEFCDALGIGTVFGVGGELGVACEHPVLEKDWSITNVTKSNFNKARVQIGTSGSGNHFVEFGILTLPNKEFGLDPGSYIALMSHSGSRGPGAAVCDHYSRIAQQMLPTRYKDVGRLGWLDLSTNDGMEYWLAMNLMGEYAEANHAIIHDRVTKFVGAEILYTIENHHNFAWKEIHNGKELIVHRKGATPAGQGVLGVIPGSMGSPAFVVRGKGNVDSLCSASHGAGRAMSRTKARDTFRWNAVRGDLAAKGITVLSAGADEVPGAYKDIHQVMAEQTDLVDTVAQFDPKIVMMCGDDSKPED